MRASARDKPAQHHSDVDAGLHFMFHIIAQMHK